MTDHTFDLSYMNGSIIGKGEWGQSPYGGSKWNRKRIEFPEGMVCLDGLEDIQAGSISQNISTGQLTISQTGVYAFLIGFNRNDFGCEV